MKKTAIISIPILLLSLGIVAFRQVEDNDRYFQIVKNLDIFVTLFKEVNTYYVDEVNPNELMKVGIDAMLKSLDPYTNYIPEDDIEDYMTMTTGEYGGIGALVDKKNGFNTVIMLYEDSPAERAGLKIGDEILKINDIDLEGKNADDISLLLDGASRSQIKMLVNRFNTEPFEVFLKREKITINNVPYYGMINDEVGYIRLTDFTTKAGKEVSNALKELKEDGATRMILDLRGNPGGLLDEAVNVSNVFVDKGKEIVSTKGKLSSWSKIYRAPVEAVDTDIPLVVLTDNGSASAAEIVAGVIQDYDRGVLVGRKTYGKGLVQQTRPLAYNSQLKVTTAKYYIPSGRCIQAIDYSNRNPDGSVGKIPDSLKTDFQTESGRIVYDGGGLDPDVEVDRFNYSKVSYALLRNDLIFNYSTEYYYTKDPVSSAKDFKLADTDYQDFVEWVGSKDYAYTTDVERNLDKLIEVAKKEKYYEQMKTEIEALQVAALENKGSDLELFDKEIKILLEQEIVSRYFHQEGAIESTFNKDRDILKAMEILTDTDTYNSLLKPL